LARIVKKIAFFFQAEDGIRDGHVTGVQTCALPILSPKSASTAAGERTLDRIDRRLLARLQQDGRAAVSQLAREVHLTVTPTLERSEERRVGKECRSLWTVSE